jgi:uncharacterized protein
MVLAINYALSFPHLAMALGYAALLMLCAQRIAETALGRRLAAAGRMAFSNYVGSSLVAMLVMRHWAGGLWGELDRLQMLAVVLAMWLLILAWSQFWLDRFRYGPLEWVWRCLTYWRWFPMLRHPGASRDLPR